MVQTLKGPLMSDLVDTIKEIRTMHQKGQHTAKYQSNAVVIRREIKLV